MGIVIRALVVYAFLWVLLRAMGKRELGELTAFELLLLVVLGDLVQQGVTLEDHSLVGSVLAASTLALVVVATSYVSFRWPATRGALEGVPAVVIRDGRFIDEVIRLERITHDEILDAARAQGVRDISDVELAVLEADGRFSFIPSSAGQGEGHHESVS